MRSTVALAAVTVAVVLGCGAPSASPDAGFGPDGGAIVLADFSLPDVNPASPTGGRNVSPRDFNGRVSAWYFGHSS
ncbi:MAG: hypothetical protein AB1730_16845 [Myxococcota bacterium]|jgi:hypothetical protein